MLLRPSSTLEITSHTSTVINNESHQRCCVVNIEKDFAKVKMKLLSLVVALFVSFASGADMNKYYKRFVFHRILIAHGLVEQEPNSLSRSQKSQELLN
jgi:hypothetical protein